MATNQPDCDAAAEISRTTQSVDERLQDVGPLSGGWNGLTRQADEILDQTTEAVELVSQLDLSLYAQHDPFPDWHDSKPFEPMLRAVLLGELEDTSDAAVHRTLDDNPDVATGLGFDPTDIPKTCTINRARRERFAELETKIDVSTRQIKALAARKGSPIGAPTADDASEEPTGSSKRTVNRLIRGKTREVLDELTTVVFPAIDFDRSDDAIYDDHELLLLETLLGITGSAAHGGAETFGDHVNPVPDLDDPFFEDGPSGETLLTAIKALEPVAIAEMINRGAARVLTRAKPYLEFEHSVQLAIDMTYVAYYGERDELVRVQGAPDDKSYDWCHKYATANVVGDNVLFTAAMLPVGNADNHDTAAYPGKDKSYRAGGVIRQLIEIVEERTALNVWQLFADREFHAADVIAALEARDIWYVIPAKRDDRIKRFIARMDDKVAVKDEYVMHGPVKGKVTNTRVETTLVGLPPDEDHDEVQAFLTNLDVDDEIGLDRRLTKNRINQYSRRGGIETAYSKVKEFAPWTTSKDFSIRLFHFGFAVLLYDMWLLVDFLVQTALGVVEFRPKPRVTAPRFRNFLNRRLIKLI